MKSESIISGAAVASAAAKRDGCEIIVIGGNKAAYQADSSVTCCSVWRSWRKLKSKRNDISEKAHATSTAAALKSA